MSTPVIHLQAGPRHRSTGRVLITSADGQHASVWGDEPWEDGAFHQQLVEYLVHLDTPESRHGAEAHRALGSLRSAFEQAERSGVQVGPGAVLIEQLPDGTEDERRVRRYLLAEAERWVQRGSKSREHPDYVTDLRAPVAQARQDVRKIFDGLAAIGAELEDAREPVRALVLRMARQLAEANERIRELKEKSESANE